MKPRQIPWKWILFGLAALVIVGFVLLPRQFADSSRLAQRITDVLSDWTGGDVKLTGPLRVRYFPDVALKGGFELANASRLPLVKSITAQNAKVSLDVAALLMGRIRIDAIRLYGPEIVLKDAPSLVLSPDHTLQARATNLLSGAPVGVVRVSDGVLRMPTAAGIETIDKVDVRLDASSGNGSVSSSGTFVLRDEKVGFVLKCSAPVQTADNLQVPISLSVTSKPVTAKITGMALLANSLEVDGNVQAEAPDARGFLRWAGVPLPIGQSLKRLTLWGSGHWNGTTLTLDDGTFSLDGNAAVGLLAVTPGERPRLEGTLAFDRLALEPYFGGNAVDVPEAAQGGLADQAILKFFDADLRVSAANITAPALKLGRGGFTITAKDGVVASEVGELELCGGSAAGRIGADLRKTMAKTNVMASLSDIPVETCLAGLVPEISVNGTGTLKAELTAEGRNFEDLVQGLSGTVKLNARNGAVPVDFARLLNAAPPLEGDGWSRNGASVYDQLQAECRLDSGHISCDMFNMQTRRGLISGSGGVDLNQQTLDWHLFVASDAQPLKASQLSVETPPRISISGPLSHPAIRRADRPTFGEGSVPANPAATQVSPR